jgi:tetratricopeptide (TPR) repeat protein
MVRLHLVIALLLISGILWPLLAQHSTADSLCARADSLLSQGQAAAAESLFDAALESNEHHPRALFGLGRARVMLRDWSRAANAFDDALEQDSFSLASRYYLGICYRELGKTKGFLLRKFDWNRAENYFLSVLGRDSTYEDTFAQYALLLQYREQYADAIQAGHRQIAIHPGREDIRLALFKSYRVFVANDRRTALEWLRPRQTPIAQYFLGEALRREGMAAQADTLFRRLLYQSKFSLAQPVYLSLARIAVERQQPQAAEGYYLRAVDELISPLGAAIMFEDIKHIVSDREIDTFRSLHTVDEQAQFFRSFWAVRNPSATATNPRLIEHFRRLLYAEQNFEYTGFRTEFTNPDRLKYLTFPRSYELNEEFNDKGLVYLRHGAPENIARSMSSAEPAESWLYEATGDAPRRMYHFIKVNAPGNNWRLTAYPQDPNLLATLVSWDPLFADLASSNTSIEAKARDAVIAQEQEAVQQGLMSDNHTWTKEVASFPVSHSVEAFRSTGGRSLIDISYAIALSDIARHVPSEQQSIPTEIGIALRSLTGRVAITNADTIMFPTGDGAAGAYTSLFRYRVLPDAYSIVMHVRPLGTNLFASWNDQKTVPSFNGPELAMSDVQFLLPSTAKTMLEFDGVKVAPNPYSQHPTDRPLYTYCQIYHLAKDQDGRSSYDVRYLVTAANDTAADRAGRHPIELAASIDVTTEEFAAVFKKLDISDLETGQYILTLSVTDRRTGKGTRTSRPLTVYSP